VKNVTKKNINVKLKIIYNLDKYGLTSIFKYLYFNSLIFSKFQYLSPGSGTPNRERCNGDISSNIFSNL